MHLNESTQCESLEIKTASSSAVKWAIFVCNFTKVQCGSVYKGGLLCVNVRVPALSHILRGESTVRLTLRTSPVVESLDRFGRESLNVGFLRGHRINVRHGKFLFFCFTYDEEKLRQLGLPAQSVLEHRELLEISASVSAFPKLEISACVSAFLILGSVHVILYWLTYITQRLSVECVGGFGGMDTTSRHEKWRGTLCSLVCKPRARGVLT